MTDIVRIPFHDDEILTVDVGGQPHIALKPALESIGLDYWAQIERLRRRSWAVTRKTRVTAADGKEYDSLTCDVRTFLMLLATVDERRVGTDVKPKLVQYQAEVAEVIESYWTQGYAINPRAGQEQMDRAEREISLIKAAQGVIDDKHLEAKARVVLARGLGEAPQIPDRDRPLYVQDYLKEQGLSDSELRSMSGVFGRRLKATYELEHDVEPSLHLQNLPNGQTRNVRAYTENDRPIFDDVWQRYYQNGDTA